MRTLLKTGAFVIYFSLVSYSQSDEQMIGTLEVWIQQIGVNEGDTVTYTMTGQGSIMWDDNYMLTDSNSYWNPSAVKLGETDTSKYSKGWDFVNGQNSVAPVVAYGLYKFTQNYIDPEYYWYIDFRDHVHGTSGDVRLIFKDVGVLYAMGYNPDKQWPLLSFNSGDTIKVWKLKRGSSALATTGRFQPTDPTNLSITTSNNHPNLTWNKSEPTDSARYLIYRSQNSQSNFQLICNYTITNNSYIDTDVDLESGSDIYYYRILAKSGDSSTSSASYSNVDSTYLIPTNPADLIITSAGNRPKLTWHRSTHPSNATYQVYRSINNQSNFSQITEEALSDVTFTDPEVKLGSGFTLFYYRIRAFNSDGSRSSPGYSNVDSTTGLYQPYKLGTAQAQIPSETKIKDVYPNPFNPSTTIRYQLSALSRVKFEIYDVLGRRLVTLVNDMKEPGYYIEIFNGSPFASGIYFMHMIIDPLNGTAPAVETRKILLTK